MSKIQDRRIKKSPALIRFIIDQLRGGSTLTAAAEAADVSTVTIWHWRNEDPVLEAKVQRAMKAGARVAR